VGKHRQVVGLEAGLDTGRQVGANKYAGRGGEHKTYEQLPHTQCAVSTYMVPLQEHQRPAPVLVQQLLSALLQGQLGVALLLALHQASAHGQGVHHGLDTDLLRLAHALRGTNRDTPWARVRCVSVRTRRDSGSVEAALTWVSCRGRSASAGRLKSHMCDSVTGSSGESLSSPLSLSHKLGCVRTGGSISPHMINGEAVQSASEYLANVYVRCQIILMFNFPGTLTYLNVLSGQPEKGW